MNRLMQNLRRLQSGLGIVSNPLDVWAIPAVKEATPSLSVEEIMTAYLAISTTPCEVCAGRGHSPYICGTLFTIDRTVKGTPMADYHNMTKRCKYMENYGIKARRAGGLGFLKQSVNSRLTGVMFDSDVKQMQTDMNTELQDWEADPLNREVLKQYEKLLRRVLEGRSCEICSGKGHTGWFCGTNLRIWQKVSSLVKLDPECGLLEELSSFWERKHMGCHNNIIAYEQAIGKKKDSLTDYRTRLTKAVKNSDPLEFAKLGPACDSYYKRLSIIAPKKKAIRKAKAKKQSEEPVFQRKPDVPRGIPPNPELPAHMEGLDVGEPLL